MTIIGSILNTYSIESVSTPNETGLVSEEERHRFLAGLQAKTSFTMIPAFIFLGLLAVIGLIGNPLVLYVYSLKLVQKPITVLIITMAFFDLLGSAFAIPLEVYDMLHIWEFTDEVLCKITIFVASFTTLSSAAALLAIALTRYRKVCVPYGKQLSLRQAKIVSVSIAFVGMLFSIPNTVINGRHTRGTPRPDIKSTECEMDDRYADTMWPFINGGFYIALFVVTSVPLIYLYVRIGITAWKHSKLHGVPFLSEPPTRTFASTTEMAAPEPMSRAMSRHSMVSTKKYEKSFASAGSDVDNMPQVDKENRRRSLNNNAETSLPMIKDSICLFKDSSGRYRTQNRDDAIDEGMPGVESDHAEPGIATDLQYSVGRDHEIDIGNHSCDVMEEYPDSRRITLRKRQVAGNKLSDPDVVEAENGHSIDPGNATDLHYGNMMDHGTDVGNYTCEVRKECHDAKRITVRKRQVVGTELGYPPVILRGRCAEHSKKESEPTRRWRSIFPFRDKTRRNRPLAVLHQDSTETTEGDKNCVDNDFANPPETDVSTSKETVPVFAADSLRILEMPGKGDFFQVPETQESKFAQNEISHDPIHAMQSAISKVKQPHDSFGKPESIITVEMGKTNLSQKEIIKSQGKDVDVPLTSVCRERKHYSLDERSQSTKDGSQNLSFAEDPSGTSVTTGLKSDKFDTLSSTLRTYDTNGNATGTGSGVIQQGTSGATLSQARPASETVEQMGTSSDKKTDLKLSPAPVRRRPMGRTTTMLFIITSIYVVSYLPNLGLSAFKNLDPVGFRTMSTTGFFLYNFFVRSYFLHCGANPVIYSLCDKDFRRECASVFRCRRA